MQNLLRAVVVALSAVLASSFTVAARCSDDPPPLATPERPVTAKYDPGLPPDAIAYERAQYTQSIAAYTESFGGGDIIDPVPIAKMTDTRWLQPGGMDGITGWTSERYRTIPDRGAVHKWLGYIGVKNSSGYIQQNRGLLRNYPDGTRFDEVLRNEGTGNVFEHRVRIKKDGKWVSEVYHKDETEYPKGYTGLKVSCSSCHNEAGTGGYAEGLVPGGDTVLSDPLPWELWSSANPESLSIRRRAPVKTAPMSPPDPPAVQSDPPKAPVPAPKAPVPAPKAPEPKTITLPAAPATGACANGQCPTVSSPRRGLFRR